MESTLPIVSVSSILVIIRLCGENIGNCSNADEISLVFIDGELQECKDLSHLAEARRESIKKRKEACNISSNEGLPPGNDEPEK